MKPLHKSQPNFRSKKSGTFLFYVYGNIQNQRFYYPGIRSSGIKLYHTFFDISILIYSFEHFAYCGRATHSFVILNNKIHFLILGIVNFFFVVFEMFPVSSRYLYEFRDKTER